MAALTTSDPGVTTMAVHSISIPVPAPQRGLLQAFAHPRDFVRNHREIPGSCPPAALLADRESTAAQPCNVSGLLPDEALGSTGFVALLEPAEAAEARALHSRRRLGEALEYGFALLDALDLPPLALDVIDDAIAVLDALDAPDEDLEPYLAGTWHSLHWLLDGELEDEHDEEDDPGEAEPDGEPSIGWPNDFRAQLDPGRNWEADYDREAVNEDGSDDGREDHGWFAGEFDVPQVMRGMVEDARRQPAVLHG